MLSDRQAVVAALQKQVQKEVRQPGGERVASGSPALDAALLGGLRRGTLVEWLGEEGSGATTLALLLARHASQAGQTLVVVDRQRRFYPPAAAALGIDLRNTVVVRPTSLLDHEWTLNQALRCPAVAAVLCWPQKVDSRAFRRLQLAAEKGGSLGLLLRDATALHEPSWADVRLQVHPLRSPERRRFQVEVLRCRGSACGRSVAVEINDEGLLDDADPVHSVPELAPATAHQRSTRA